MAAALIPVGLELGQLLAATLATQGAGKLANHILSGGIKGVTKSAEDKLLQLGKNLYKQSLTQAGREKLLKKGQFLGLKGVRGTTDVVNFLQKHSLVNKSLADKLISGTQKGGATFQKGLGKLSRLNYSLSNLFGSR